MAYLVIIELEDWEHIHSSVNILTGEIVEFEQDFVNSTRVSLVEKYRSNNDLPVVELKDLHAVFLEGLPNYKNYKNKVLKQGKQNGRQ